MDASNVIAKVFVLGQEIYNAERTRKRSKQRSSELKELDQKIALTTSNLTQSAPKIEDVGKASDEPEKTTVLDSGNTLLGEDSGVTRLKEIQVTSKGKECRPCTSDHLSTCAGALSEALRFARADGMESEEVQDRLTLCAQEINIWERWDAAPKSFVELSNQDQDFLRRWLPKGRGFKHKVNSCETLVQLEQVAAMAERLHQEARKELRAMRKSPLSEKAVQDE